MMLERMGLLNHDDIEGQTCPRTDGMSEAWGSSKRPALSLSKGRPQPVLRAERTGTT